MTYDIYAVCSNGHTVDRVPFGDLFHLHKEVCPTCGDPKSNWDKITKQGPTQITGGNDMGLLLILLAIMTAIPIAIMMVYL